MTIPETFDAIFAGLKRAHGTYRITGTKGAKQVGEAVTLKEEVTLSLWEKHLAGEQGLGIIPIRDDSTCVFGAIDIDKYSGIDVTKIIRNIRNKKYPLVPCLSKSGGLHLYIFFKEATSAEVVRGLLQAMAAALGFGDSEVFPKQSHVLVERGDLGSWINMPYFNVVDTARCALSDTGERLAVEQFILLVETHKVGPDYKLLQQSTGDLQDGPPCLQHILERGVEQGARNDTLFNIGVYLKQAVPDTWEGKLQEINKKHFIPPLNRVEVSVITKSLYRRDYLYACSKPPMKTFCDRGACRGRTFGIGTNGDFPILTSLTKYDTSPPTWFVDVEGGGRLELTTEELQNQLRFQRKCMEFLNSMPPTIKPEQWRGLIQTLMEKIIVIAAPQEASASGQLINHLEAFCSSRAQARTKEEILIGKPWLINGRHHFRLTDFIDFLERKKFRDFKVHQITKTLKEKLSGDHVFLKIKDKGINVWTVPEFKKISDTQLALPELSKEEPF